MKINVTMENFDSAVIKSVKPVIVDFYADWCGPCRMLGEVLDEIAEERDDVVIARVNVDDEMALAEAFKVSAIPKLVVVKDGKIVADEVGFMTKAEVLSLLK